jgi:hypothetical protein
MACYSLLCTEEISMDRPFANHRNEIERQIIVQLVSDLLAAGYSVGVNDGEDDTLAPCRDEAQIYGAMSTTDEDRLLTESAEGRRGWVWLVYGNGADVISDYTTDLPEEVLRRAFDLADRFAGRMS